MKVLQVIEKYTFVLWLYNVNKKVNSRKKTTTLIQEFCLCFFSCEFFRSIYFSLSEQKTFIIHVVYSKSSLWKKIYIICIIGTNIILSYATCKHKNICTKIFPQNIFISLWQLLHILLSTFIGVRVCYKHTEYSDTHKPSLIPRFPASAPGNEATHKLFTSSALPGYQQLVSCPAHAHIPARNGLVNDIEFQKQ